MLKLGDNQMMYGSTLFKKCPECSGLIIEDTVRSGNTYDATFWTDGKMDAPMLPDEPWLVKCPHCLALLWIDELEIVREIESFEEVEMLMDDEAYKHVQNYIEPELGDYFSELRGNEYDEKKEQYIRLRTWWSGNDKRRNDKGIKQTLSDEEVKNLQVLYEMLDPVDDNDRITMAEIMREIGEFKKAEMILAEPFSEEFMQTVSFIKQLIRNKDPFVSKIDYEN